MKKALDKQLNDCIYDYEGKIKAQSAIANNRVLASSLRAEHGDIDLCQGYLNKNRFYQRAKEMVDRCSD